MTRLIDLLAPLDDQDPEGTIYAAEPWTAGSEATVAEVGSPEASDALASGQTYLLEVAIAKDVLDTWSRWRGGRAPSPAEAADAIVHYALTDAYLPPVS